MESLKCGQDDQICGNDAGRCCCSFGVKQIEFAPDRFWTDLFVLTSSASSGCHEFENGTYVCICTYDLTYKDPVTGCNVTDRGEPHRIFVWTFMCSALFGLSKTNEWLPCAKQKPQKFKLFLNVAINNLSLLIFLSSSPTAARRSKVEYNATNMPLIHSLNKTVIDSLNKVSG